MRFFILAFLLTYCQLVNAQQKFTINGYVKDSLSGETFIGATITVKESGKGVSTNQYGFYSITLPQGSYTLIFSYVGFVAQEFPLDLQESKLMNVSLVSKSALNDVVVFSKKRDINVKSAQMGKVDLSIEKIKSIPVVFGEVDILKSIQLLPGVRNTGEGNAGLYVRGGGPDQNLVVLDDAVVYNPGHLFGFFSVFNSDAIKNVSLIKGGMPAQYGGRLSSVVDVTMKDGNMNKLQVDAGIGLIASRLSVQGPIKKNVASFMVSARRTYIDVLAAPLIPDSSDFKGSGYFFYDVNAKLNWKINENNRLFLSGYFGRDVFTFRNKRRRLNTDIPWGNNTATLRWNHVFNRKLFANTTLLYNEYNFSFAARQNDFQIGLSSGIQDLTAKTDFDFYPTPQHKLKFGAMFTKHTFFPNIVTGGQGDVVFKPNNALQKYANEIAVYVQDDWEISEKLKVNAGLRFSWFQQVGPYKIYTKDAGGNNIDSTVFGSGDPIITYSGLEPRLTVRYAIDDETSIKAAITQNYQYIHLVTSAGTTLPTDLWVPSTYLVKPQIAWQYAAGFFKNFDDNTWETSLELYYKDMQNQIEYREGYTPSLRDPEQEFTYGRGWSYGAELFVNKTKGRFTGWLGYTLSWTDRQFPKLNSNQVFPYRFDRRHDLSLVANYDLNKKWRFGAVFVYASGNAFTAPERFYVINNVLQQEYSRVNQYRLPDYHRFDISATYTPQPKKPRKWQGSWVFSIYNLYSRQNPYFIYFDQEGSLPAGTLQVQAYQVSLFPILPSVTYNIKF
jgi:hypothetical protein